MSTGVDVVTVFVDVVDKVVDSVVVKGRVEWLVVESSFYCVLST